MGIAVPQIRDADGTVFRSLRRSRRSIACGLKPCLGIPARLGLFEVLDEPSDYEVSQDVDWATGAVMIISAACRKPQGIGMSHSSSTRKRSTTVASA